MRYLLFIASVYQEVSGAGPRWEKAIREVDEFDSQRFRLEREIKQTKEILVSEVGPCGQKIAVATAVRDDLTHFMSTTKYVRESPETVAFNTEGDDLNYLEHFLDARTAPLKSRDTEVTRAFAKEVTAIIADGVEPDRALHILENLIDRAAEHCSQKYNSITKLVTQLERDLKKARVYAKASVLKVILGLNAEIKNPETSAHQRDELRRIRAPYRDRAAHNLRSAIQQQRVNHLPE